MAIGSGLGASVGVAAESSYGTYVAPTRFYEFESETFHDVPTFVQGGGIAAGSYTRRGARRSIAAYSAEGNLVMDVPDKGFGLLLNMLLGSVTGPTLETGATTARRQTHVMGDNAGKSFTAQVGVPQTNGTVVPHTFLGGKLLSAEFECSVGELLKVTLGCDFRQNSSAQTLAAPSYTAGISNFTFVGMSVLAGAVGAEVAVNGVTGMKLTINRQLKTDRNYAGASGLKAEPITNDYVELSGSITSDYLDQATFADRFKDNESTSIVWEFVGNEIESGHNSRLRIELPMTYFEGTTPQVGGPDVVSTEFPFVVLDDGTNPVVSVDYVSSDTAV